MMCTVTKGRQVTEANPNLVRCTVPVQSLYSPCTVPVQSRLQSRLRKLVTKPSSLCSRGNIKIDGYLDSKESTGTVDFPHKSQPGLYRDCTGTVPGLYRECTGTVTQTARTHLGAALTNISIAGLPHMTRSNNSRT